jgi:hypothetical protein
MWNAYLRQRNPNITLTPEDVCMFNILQKAARLAAGTHDDSLIDIAGYVENIAQLLPEQRNGATQSPTGISDNPD